MADYADYVIIVEEGLVWLLSVFGPIEVFNLSLMNSRRASFPTLVYSLFFAIVTLNKNTIVNSCQATAPYMEQQKEVLF